MKSKHGLVAAKVIARRYGDAWGEVLTAALNGDLEKVTGRIAERVATNLLLGLRLSSPTEKDRYQLTRQRIDKEIRELLRTDNGGVSMGIPLPLGSLSNLIERAEIKPSYRIENVKHVPIRPEVIRLGEPFKVGAYQCVSVATIEKGDATQQLLALLAQVLDRGLLANLRTCKQCQKLIIAKNRGREFCYNSKCADAYHNANKTRKGYWSDNRVKRKRAKRKARFRAHRGTTTPNPSLSK